ncbi:hypothetical protein TTHERM_00891200 (macronuclear) [Tetrahymena thermophila SB210]|uniref:Uncharacterized protein n=1 Tax=Tetrahymena thermophila (strain SB210) TaxID=312017 RepID=Q23U77_TETTS|nr:hypothetical protein TTHERM_00891200 [Tetrahymena thermophila SB210]EAS00067.1 hypothetical protein TTHERM_00891200 [Tetrahymena thermophila SB210]|eukprot:XP_001020312.1 hypothetical protein TTHERM_00891200 [Tetrahymena thermophila SB210]
MNWKLPEDIEIDEIIYLQEKVYPKLKESFLYLVQYLMESGEHLDQYRAQRREEYESLLQEREDLIKKGQQEQGSDYDQSSDDEKKKVDQKIKNFENLHKNEMEHIKTDRSQQDSNRRTSRQEQLNEYIKSQQKQYYEDQVIEQQNNINGRNNQAEGEESSKSQNKFKRIDRFSEASSDNGTDPDEYIRRDSYQRNQSFHVFNPLVFLAQELKKRNQQTK